MKIQATVVACVRAAPHIGQSVKKGLLTADDFGAAGVQSLHAASRFEPCAIHAAAGCSGNGKAGEETEQSIRLDQDLSSFPFSPGLAGCTLASAISLSSRRNTSTWPPAILLSAVMKAISGPYSAETPSLFSHLAVTLAVFNCK